MGRSAIIQKHYAVDSDTGANLNGESTKPNKRGDRDQNQGCSGPQVGHEWKINAASLAVQPLNPDEGRMNFL
jgi:hypothetical protein